MEKAQSVRMCRKNTEGRGNHPDFTALSSINICRRTSARICQGRLIPDKPSRKVSKSTSCSSVIVLTRSSGIKER